MPDSAPSESAATRLKSSLGLGLLILGLTLAALGVISPYSLLTVLMDGVLACLIVGPAAGLGLCLIPLLRLGGMPLRWHFLAGSALGLGVISLLVLALGLAGILDRTVWTVLLGAFGGAGLLRLRMLLQDRVPANDDVRLETKHPKDSDVGKRITGSPIKKSDLRPWSTENRQSPAPLRSLWLLACPFAVMTLLAAATPPGFIWSEEGYGYDVLEYHLQLPKEYLESGRISYISHNVYANFPAQVEMLYLLGMIIHADPAEAGVTANLIHASFALLTVFAAWVVGRQWSERCATICGVVTACNGWLVYLSGLAYVENAMVFFGMASAGALLRATRYSERDPQREPGFQSPESRGVRTTSIVWMILSGLCAGFACGCKYTALPMIAIPMALSIPIAWVAPWRLRVAGVTTFSLAAAAAFAPWLAKNQVMAGNPVFPLLNHWFEAAPPGWGPEQTEQWQRGHAAQTNDQSATGRLRGIWDQILGDKYQRWGPLVLLMGAVCLFVRPWSRVEGFLLTYLVLQFMCWLFATHMYARFAVPMLVPLTLLAGRMGRFWTSPSDPPPIDNATSDAKGRSEALPHHGLVAWCPRGLVPSVMIAGAVWNFAFAARLQWQEIPVGVQAAWLYEGRLPGYEYMQTVNRALLPDAKILLVGDARAYYFRRMVDYCVTFNRNPLAEAVRTAHSDAEIIDWLQRQRYSHVLVNWSEIRRLTKTYGFPPELNQHLFDRLKEHGLSPQREFHLPNDPRPFVTLFRLSPPSEHRPLDLTGH